MSKEFELMKVEDINIMCLFIFLYYVIVMVLKYVKDLVGDEFEFALYGVFMELFLFVVIICVVFWVEVVSMFYVVVIMFVCIEFVVLIICGKVFVLFWYGIFSVIGMLMRILTDLWRFLNRMRRIRSNVIMVVDIMLLLI